MRCALGAALLAAASFAINAAFAGPPPTFTVITTADSSDGSCTPTACSLRDAINAANAAGGATIDFAIGTGGVQTITLTNPLPGLAVPVTIDGTTQAGTAGSPFGIAVDGDLETGLRLQPGSGGSTIRGLALGDFEGAAILVQSDGNTIAGNSLGIGAAGQASGNEGGIVVQGSSNTIGGGDPADRNVVVNNTGGSGANGIFIQGSGTNVPTGNNVLGNYVGVLGDGTTVAGNEASDIEVVDAKDTTIGGPDKADGNVLAGAGTPDAVFLGNFQDSSGTGTTVENNLIGLKADGSGSLYANSVSGNGIDVEDDGANTIADNTIADMYQGIDICDSPSNTVTGNLVGSNTASPGGPDFGMGNQGISVEDGACQEVGPATGNVIGGAAGEGNVVVGSQLDDLVLDADQNTASYNTFRGTKGGAVVQISGNGNQLASNTIAGGKTDNQNPSSPIPGNGVEVDGGTGNTISQNSVHGDAALGIALQSNPTPTPLPNDPTDADGGPNDQQNYPILDQSKTSFSGDNLTVTATLDSAPSTTYRIEFFQSSSGNPSGNGEGTKYVGSTTTTTDGNGHSSFSPTFSDASSGKVITATATAPDGSTSEFSPWITANGTPETFVVNNTSDNDDGSCTDDACSLRDAINAANLAGGGTIKFQIPGTGPFTIEPDGGLPAITAPTAIDGYTQFGAVPNTQGLAQGDDAHLQIVLVDGGLTVDAGGAGSVIRGLSFTSAFGSGTAIDVEADDVTVAGNFIGLGPDGKNHGTTLTTGVMAAGSNDVIGGPDPADRNVIGNADFLQPSGIDLSSGSGTVVQGNYIGTDATGRTAARNDVGIGFLDGATGDTVRGNLISGNQGDGIDVTGAGATGNTIVGNFIGTTADGTAKLGNGQNGIFVTSDGNTIGGAGSDANVISGNADDGVDVGAASGTQIVGNVVGLAADGKTALGNGSFGIELGTSDTTAIQDNVVSANASGGLLLGGGASGTAITGNLIGTDESGSTARGNGVDVTGYGIDIASATGTVIGGTDSASANVISANAGTGIEIDGGDATVQGDFIGTDATGTSALGNGSDGIYISTSGNTIGGDALGAGNVISGNTGEGVHIEGSEASGNTVAGNLIGTDATGSEPLGNTDNGILVNAGAANNTIGGTDADAANVISANKGEGGLAPVGGGVDLDFGPGIGNVVEGNLIGTDISGSSDLGNANFGVSITGSTQTIGGTVAGSGNTIAFNSGPGVHVVSGDEDVIRRNSIHDNAGLGIALDPGANDGIAAPTVTSVVGNTVSGTVTGSSGDQIIVEVFGNATCADAANGAGRDFLGTSLPVTAEGTTTPVTWTATIAGLASDEGVTATATDETPDTSQFSTCATVNAGTLSVQLSTNSVNDADLTAAGTEDWAVWGYANNGTSTSLAPDVRKAGGSGISNLTDIDPNGAPLRGLGQFASQGAEPYTFDWSDGTIPTSATGADAGLEHDGQPGLLGANGDGFSFTVPADTTQRTVTVYTSEHWASGTLTATLSDGSAQPYTQTLTSTPDQNLGIHDNDPGVYTIDYAAASAGQHLTVQLVETAANCPSYGCDDAAIYAVALSGPAGGSASSASASLGPVADVAMSAAVPTSGIPLAAFYPQPPGAPPLTLNGLQLANTQLANTQLANTQLAHTQLANTGLPLNSVPLNSTLYPDGWAGLLQGTTLAGEPLQTITLHDALALTTADVTSPPNGETAQDVIDKIQGLSFADLDLPSSVLGQVTVGALALGGAEVNELGGDLQDAVESQLQSWCESFVASTGAPSSFCSGADPGLGYLSLIQLGLLGAPVASLQLANTQLANTQLANTQLANTQLANTPLSASASGIVGMQLANTDLSTGFGLDDLVVGDFPGDVNALFYCSTPPSNFDCTTGTLAQAQAAGAIKPTTTVGDLDQGHFLDKVTIAQLLATVLGPNSAYRDVVNFGDLVGLFLRNSDVQWESLSPDVLAIFDPNRPSTSVTAGFDIQGTGSPAADVKLLFPAGFDYVPSSATLSENGNAGLPPGDPAITNTANGLVLDWHLDSVVPGASYTITFKVFGGTTVGPTRATETVTAGGHADSSTQPFSVTDSNPDNGSAADATPIDTTAGHDSVEMSTLPTAGAVDYYTFPMPAAGTRISVHLTNLPADYDLALYSPRTTSVRTTTSVDPSAPPLQDGVVPDTQVNLNGGSSGQLTPSGLEDVPNPGIPLVQLSDNRHQDDEDVGMVSPGGGGSITVAVFGYNGAFSPDAYTLRVRETAPPATQICSARSLPFANTPSAGTEIDSLSTNLASIPADVNTIVLADEKRLGDTYGLGAEQTAVTALDGLANGDQSLGVSGVVVPVEQIAGVQALYDTWDSNPCDPSSANAIANAIADEVDTIVAAHPTIKYVVFAGGDDQIPFFRLPDLSLIANESGFAGQFSPNEYQGSLAAGDLLSDDPYLDTHPVPASGQQLFPPNLSGGRLVETPQEIADAVTNFEAANGALKSSTGFVSGYDFVADGSEAVANNLKANGVNVSTLIDDPLNPPASLFGSSDLLDAAFPPTGTGTPADINSWNGHYDNYRAQMANGDIISTSDLPSGLDGGIFFTMGCHAGFQTTDAVVGSTVLDWPQYFAEHDTGFVGNTGFGLGDTDSVAFSEQLMADFAGQINGSNSLGQALLQAKRQYYLSRVAFSNYDEKALSEAELYGLPMYGIGHSPDALVDPADPGPDPVTGATASTSPSQGSLSSFPGNGVESSNFAVTPDFTGPIMGQYGEYYTNAGQVQAPNYRPLQPYVSLPAGRTDSPGLLAHGVVIDTLTSRDDPGPPSSPSGFLPDNVRPTLNTSAAEPPPSFSDESWPEKIPTLDSLGQDQEVDLATGQFFTQTSGSGTTGVERLWTQIGGRVTYSTSQDFTPPTIDSISAFESDAGQPDDVLAFTGRFSDVDPTKSNGQGSVVFAQVIYDDGTGHWQPLRLQQDQATGIWSAGVPFTGSHVQYFVEICDAAGNCGYSSNKGNYFDAQALPPGNVSAGTLTISPSRPADTGAWYHGALTVTADTTASATVSVSVDGGQPTAGPVTLSGDGVHIVVATDSDGDTATAAYLIDTTPPTKPTFKGITDGATYAPGTLPAQSSITCSASDVLSGLDECSVSGYGTALGPHTLTATATDHAGNTSTSTLSYSVKADPTITWNPASILFGAVLGPAQLNATANVAGSFVYTPAAGTLLQPGTQTLSTTFTPADTADYNTVTASRTITVGFSQACQTGSRSGSLTIKRGTAYCIQGGTVSGSITVQSGGSLYVSRGTLSGSLASSGATALTLCGTTVSGSISISSSSGLVELGGPSGSGCAADKLFSSISLSGNKAGVTAVGNTIRGSLTASSNKGGFLFSGNTESGSVSVSGNSGGVTFTDNVISGSVAITNNTGGFTYSGNTIFGSVTLRNNT